MVDDRYNLEDREYNLEPLNTSNLDLPGSETVSEGVTVPGAVSEDEKPSIGGVADKKSDTPPPSQEGVLTQEKSEIDNEDKERRNKTYEKILSKVHSHDNAVFDGLSIRDDVKRVEQVQDIDRKITMLVDIALMKGVVYAVKVAQKFQDEDQFYAIDRLHDSLLEDRFHDALVEKGLLKND